MVIKYEPPSLTIHPLLTCNQLKEGWRPPPDGVRTEMQWHINIRCKQSEQHFYVFNGKQTQCAGNAPAQQLQWQEMRPGPDHVNSSRSTCNVLHILYSSLCVNDLNVSTNNRMPHRKVLLVLFLLVLFCFFFTMPRKPRVGGMVRPGREGCKMHDNG